MKLFILAVATSTFLPICFSSSNNFSDESKGHDGSSESNAMDLMTDDINESVPPLPSLLQNPLAMPTQNNISHITTHPLAYYTPYSNPGVHTNPFYNNFPVNAGVPLPYQFPFGNFSSYTIPNFELFLNPVRIFDTPIDDGEEDKYPVVTLSDDPVPELPDEIWDSIFHFRQDDLSDPACRLTREIRPVNKKWNKKGTDMVEHVVIDEDLQNREDYLDYLGSLTALKSAVVTLVDSKAEELSVLSGNLEELTLTRQKDSDFKFSFQKLSRFQNLTELVVDLSLIKNGSIPTPNLSWPILEVLYLMIDNKFNVDFIDLDIVRAFPNLKSLTVEKHDYDNEHFVEINGLYRLGNDIGNNLENLTLKYIEFSDEVYMEFKNLKNLSFFDCKFPQDFELGGDLGTVESIEFEDAVCTSYSQPKITFLSKLLKSAKNVKKLRISRMKERMLLGSDIDNVKLDNLVEAIVDIDNEEDRETITRFLLKQKNLKTITFETKIDTNLQVLINELRRDVQIVTEQ